jgi:ubiquinone/menaquinone biosynthesis C-methylase UbiE
MTDYTDVTEVAGEQVTKEQIERICHRYYWAGEFCVGKDSLEAACGSGQGLGYLNTKSKSFKAGDYSEKLLKIAKDHYKDRIDLQQFDAQNMSFPDNSLDVIILFEALYYLDSPEKFVECCKSILRKTGTVLITTANKDLYDFNPSPHSFKYYGVQELRSLFEKYGFECEFLGYLSTHKTSVVQRILRPLKKLVVTLNLMPKTMSAKKLLKRLVFGKLVPMPAEIDPKSDSTFSAAAVGIAPDISDREYKVIYCRAVLKS